MMIRIQRGMVYSPFAGLAPVLLLGVMLSGCGVKTYPKPIPVDQAPQIQDLSTQVRLKTVELTWSVPDQLNEALKNTGYILAVLRSDVNWENRNCLECPASSPQQVATIDPRRSEPAVREGNGFTWRDAAVSVQHAYRYQIAVQDSKKQTISTSNPAVVKVLGAPPSLRSLATAPEPQGIELQWKAGAAKTTPGQPAPGQIQFLVERRSANGIWEKASPTPVRGSTFTDSTVASGQIYDYRVTPVYVFEDTLILGDSTLFSQAKAPDALPPPPPGNVWVIPVKGALEVHWVPSEGKVEGYHVYRREGKELIRLTASPLKNPPYVDGAVRKNVVYSYAVSAVGNHTGKREGLVSKWVEMRSLMID